MPVPLLHKCFSLQESSLYKNSSVYLTQPQGACSHLVLLLEWEPEMKVSPRLKDSVWGTRYSRKSPFVAVASLRCGGPLCWRPNWAECRNASNPLPQRATGAHPSHAFSPSRVLLLLFLTPSQCKNSDAPLGAGRRHHHCLTFKIKQPRHQRGKGSMCLSGSMYLGLLS